MNNLSCNIYLDILPLYVDDAVSDDTKAFVEAHLAQCEHCRRELERMTRPLEVPVETNAEPFALLKKQWAKQNALVWGLSLVLLGLFLLMALPVFDTAMQYHIQKLIGSGGEVLLWVLPLAAVSFGLEWWFLHWKKWKWMRFLLLLLPALILVWAELGWTSGGWDRFGSSLLWYGGFPVLLGAGSAALLKAVLDQPKWAKGSLAAFLTVFVLVSILLWPRRMADTLALEPEGTMLAVYPTVETRQYAIDQEALLQELQGARLSPWHTAPTWNAEDCILVRLNEEYVLMAPKYDTPYIYAYSGALEEFDGQAVCYRIYHYPALYMNLKLAGTAQSE